MEAVPGGEEREEEAMAFLWMDVTMEEGGEGGGVTHSRSVLVPVMAAGG